MFSEYLPTLSSVTSVLYFPESVASIKNIQVVDNTLIVTSDKQHRVLLPVSSPGTVTNVKKLNDYLSVVVKVENRPSSPDTHMWSCKDLLQKSQQVGGVNQFSFCCAQCRGQVVEASEYKFMDMPSEYWYELMDFWHCHKPHNDEKTSKDYGALTPQQGTVVLGTHYVLLNKQEHSQMCMGDRVVCKCGNDLGKVDPNGLTLFKWRLGLRASDLWEVYPKSLVMYNLFMDRITSLAVRKFKVKVRGVWWYVWVTNTGLSVAVGSRVLKDAMKVLYYEDREGRCKGAFFDDYEEVQVEEEIGEVLVEVGRGNGELPEISRGLEMNGLWFGVGYLERST